MQVSVEKTSELSRKMIVSVPEAIIQEKVAERLKTLARDVKIDGFRPGKVPPHVIKKMYAARVRNEVTGDLIQSTYAEAINEQKLQPAGYPQIHSTEDDDSGFKYTAEFEVYPEISLAGMTKLNIARPVAAVEDADIANMMVRLRQQRQSWRVVERNAADTDRITLNFTGEVDGESFTNGKVEGFQVEIGTNKMVPGFEANLLGLAANAHKTFEVTFPEDYGNEKLAGKLAKFDVEVVSVEEIVLPEIDAEFVKAYGIESGDVDLFKTDVTANMVRELKRALQDKLKTRVMDAINKAVPISVPNALVHNEIRQLIKPYAENAKKQNIKLEDLQLPQEAFETEAKRRVALGLILAEIIRSKEIKLDPAKVRETVEELAQSYEDSQQIVTWYYQDKTRLADIEQMVLENMVVDAVVAEATVTDENINFDAAMNKEQN
ncbi:MAG: trigger factor [Methylococcaceae bacterium]|nr:trigger factor [Methylococcaceae bacterium]